MVQLGYWLSNNSLPLVFLSPFPQFLSDFGHTAWANIGPLSQASVCWSGEGFCWCSFQLLNLTVSTISRLVAKESDIDAVKFGSPSTLYHSVSDLDELYLWSNTWKEMLLNPRNSMEAYCQRHKLNIDDSPVQYFVW